MPVHKKINKDFFKIWTREMSYILGFFAADGYMTVNKRGAHFWNIQITDGELLEKIKEVVKSEHKLSKRLRRGNEQTIYRLQVGNKEMCNDLRNLGMTERKTKSLTTPKVPEEYLSDFVRGYFDGDGNVWVGYGHKKRKNPSLVIQSTFTSCSRDFLESIRTRLKNSGVALGALRKDKGNFYRLVYSINASLKLYDFMYNEPHQLFLPRKKLIFENYIKMRL